MPISNLLKPDNIALKSYGQILYAGKRNASVVDILKYSSKR